MLGKKIAELNSEVDAWEADLAKATELRKGERADYQARAGQFGRLRCVFRRALKVCRTIFRALQVVGRRF